VIAEANDDKKLLPFITHGYSPVESAEFIRKLEYATLNGDEKVFVRNKNLAMFPLKTVNAKPAVLLDPSGLGCRLNDGGSLLPLLRVVELGLDVIALRERDRGTPSSRN
jgi:hypothetical protein